MFVSFSGEAPSGRSRASGAPGPSTNLSKQERHERWLKITDLKNLRSEIRSHVETAHATPWSPHSLPADVINLCRGKRVGLYTTVARFHEPLVMPTEILALALTGDCQLAFPRLEGDQLVFAEVKNPSRELYPTGEFEIAEPSADAPVSKPQVLVIPALAMDLAGNRIGRGRAYYDRYLAENDPDVSNPSIFTIALVHSDYVFDAFDPSWIQPHDRKARALLTESSYTPASISLRRFTK